ncbi:MAG TPA: endonuclease III [Methylococcaceae bacterium]|nr:endonuclease III [Methylococcaceae bacterium]
MTPQDSYRLFEQLAIAIPKPTTELVYSSHFELLIAVVLSAQATDKSVNKATKLLFEVANTPQKILALGEDALKGYIKTIGLFNTKAANIIKLCRQLLEKHDGNVPHLRSELESLPGVGRKTANVILNTAFGQPTIAVDTHIFRVANRIGLASANTVLGVEKALMGIIPEKFMLDAHHLLILHGRYICVARKPLCHTCVISGYCEFFQLTAH